MPLKHTPLLARRVPLQFDSYSIVLGADGASRSCGDGVAGLNGLLDHRIKRVGGIPWPRHKPDGDRRNGKRVAAD